MLKKCCRYSRSKRAFAPARLPFFIGSFALYLTARFLFLVPFISWEHIYRPADRLPSLSPSFPNQILPLSAQ